MIVLSLTCTKPGTAISFPGAVTPTRHPLTSDLLWEGGLGKDGDLGIREMGSAGYQTHRKTLWHWQGAPGAAGRLPRVQWADAPGARPARRATQSGRVAMLPYSQETKTLVFWVGFAFFPLRPRSQDSVHLSPLLFLQKGKLRQITGWLDMSTFRKERWWRGKHTEFGAKRPPFKACLRAPWVTLGQNASPGWTSAFSPVKWERAHPSCRLAVTPRWVKEVPWERDCDEYCEMQSSLLQGPPTPPTAALNKRLASPSGTFVRMRKCTVSGRRVFSWARHLGVFLMRSRKRHTFPSCSSSTQLGK